MPVKVKVYKGEPGYDYKAIIANIGDNPKLVSETGTKVVVKALDHPTQKIVIRGEDLKGAHDGTVHSFEVYQGNTLVAKITGLNITGDAFQTQLSNFSGLGPLFNAKMIFVGSDQDDFFQAANKAAVFDAGRGNDFCNGGSAADFIDAGAGNNFCTGGGGNDTFAFSTLKCMTTIQDFNPAADFIALDSDVFEGLNQPGTLKSKFISFGVNAPDGSDHFYITPDSKLFVVRPGADKQIALFSPGGVPDSAADFLVTP